MTETKKDSNTATRTVVSTAASIGAEQIAKRCVGGTAVSVLGCSVGAPFLIAVGAGLAVDMLFRLFED